MRHARKLFGVLAAAGIALGSIGSAFADTGPSKGVEVTITGNLTNVLEAYFTTTENPVALTAAIDAFTPQTVTGGSAKLFVRDGRLAPNDDGFALNVSVDVNLTSGTSSKNIPKANVFIDSSATDGAPAPVYLDGDSTKVHAFTGSRASLADAGKIVVAAEADLNVILTQTIGIEVDVPANLDLSAVYTSTLILDITQSYVAPS